MDEAPEGEMRAEHASEDGSVDDAVRAAWQSLKVERTRRGHAVAPDAEQVRAALAGELDADRREAVLDAALQAGDHDTVAMLHAARLASAGAMAGGAFAESATAATDVGRAHRARARRRSPWVGATALVALAATIVVAVWVPKRLQVAQTPAADVRGESSAVQLVAPAANVAVADTMQFVWRTMPGAQRYALELLDSAGTVVQQVATTDTTATVVLQDAARGATAWWVHATRADGTRAPGALRLLAPRAPQP